MDPGLKCTVVADMGLEITSTGEVMTEPVAGRAQKVKKKMRILRVVSLSHVEARIQSQTYENTKDLRTPFQIKSKTCNKLIVASVESLLAMNVCIASTTRLRTSVHGPMQRIWSRKPKQSIRLPRWMERRSGVAKQCVSACLHYFILY